MPVRIRTRSHIRVCVKKSKIAARIVRKSKKVRSSKLARNYGEFIRAVREQVEAEKWFENLFDLSTFEQLIKDTANVRAANYDLFE